MIVPVLTILLSNDAVYELPAELAPVIDSFPTETLAVFVTALFAILFVLKHLVTIINIGYSTAIVYRLRDMWGKRTFASKLNYSLDDLNNERAGKIIENVVGQPIRAAKFMRFLLGAFSNTILSIALLLILMLNSWQVTVTIGGIFLVASTLGIIPLKRRSANLGRKQNKLQQALTSAAAEAIAGIQQVKIFGLESRWLNQFMAVSHKLSRNQVKFVVLNEIPTLIGAVIIAAIILTAVAVWSNQDSMQTIVLFTIIGQRLHTSIANLFRNYTNLCNLKPSFDMIVAIVDTQLNTKAEGESFHSPLQRIQIQNLTYAYPGKKSILKNVDLMLDMGTITAFTGPSGSGKSTFANLLCGLLDPTSGRILVNETPLDIIDRKNWLQKIAIVSQDNFVFHDSVRNNILVGRPDADAAAMMNAAQRAGAHDFITALPNGYDSIIGERGAALSGGQIQRIAIARALVRDADLLILDEATSALDADSQSVVLKVLREEANKGKLVLMISHRTESIAIADHTYSMLTRSTVPKELQNPTL